MARDASRPDAFRRQRRAGTVKDAGGTAKRREPQATVLEGPEHRGTHSVHRTRQSATGRFFL
jgi:hypothetical protein